MTERSVKMLSTYDEQEGAAQRLTPPVTSRPWPYASDVTSTSLAPMTVPTTAAEMLDIDSLESSHSPEHHPGVVESAAHFHWGPYGVSSHDPAEELSPQLGPSQSLYSTVPPSALIRSPPYGATPSTHIPLAPALSMPPHPMDPRALDMHYQYTSNLGNISFEFGPPCPSRKSKARTSRSNRSAKRGRNNIDPNLTTGNGMAAAGAPELPPPQHLTLDPKAPEDSRYLVELRCQMSDDKGKGMWEQIQQAYKEHFGHKTKENLQMQLIRTVQSYAEWPESEVSLPPEANHKKGRTDGLIFVTGPSLEGCR